MADARGCLVDLEKLVTEQSNGNQGALLDRVSDLFFLTADQQKTSDTELFGTVMERLAFALEVEVRAQLAERMAKAGPAPRNLIRRLAQDVIAVARPVLTSSSHLTDDDLVGIASSQGQEHLRAISSRTTLSARVTDVIVERADDDVLTDVTKNEGAAFSTAGLEQISKRAESNDSLLSALEVRTDLPPDLLAKVKRTVAFRLKRDLAGSHPEMDEEALNELVDSKAAEFAGTAAGAGEREKRADYREDVTEGMLLGFARARRVPETVQSLAILSKLDVGIVAHCLLRADLAALAVLCKANGFDNTTFSALVQLRTSERPLSGKAIADAMRHYSALRVDAARQTMQQVRERFAVQASRTGPAPTA